MRNWFLKHAEDVQWMATGGGVGVALGTIIVTSSHIDPDFSLACVEPILCAVVGGLCAGCLRIFLRRRA